MPIKICNYCNNQFASSSSLYIHKKSAKYCKIQRDIIFLCKKCGLCFNSLKHIQGHTCSNTLNLEFTDSYKSIKNKGENLKEVKKENPPVFTQDTSNIDFTDTENGSTFFPKTNDGNEESSTFASDEEDYIDEVMYVDENPNNVEVNLFRSPQILQTPQMPSRWTRLEDKHYISNKPYPVYNPEIVDERRKKQILLYHKALLDTHASINLERTYSLEDVFQLLEEVETTLKDIILDASKERVDINSLQNNGDIITTVDRLTQLRFSIFRFTRQYIIYKDNMVSFMERIKQILVEAGYKEFTAINLVSNFISCLDKIIFIPTSQAHTTREYFYQRTQWLLASIESRTTDQKEYVPFIPQDFKKNFDNPYFLFLNPELIMKSFLVSRYGFHNFVFVNTHNTQRDDPHTFYMLDKINGNKRYWKIDDRMFIFCMDMIEELKTLYSRHYKLIYHQKFGTNEYIEGSEDSLSDLTRSVVTNIITLSDTYKFIKYCQNILIGWCQYTPTSNDIFDVFVEDLPTKGYLSIEKEKNIESEAKSNLRDLFTRGTNKHNLSYYTSELYNKYK